jgi:hypothetical protein
MRGGQLVHSRLYSWMVVWRNTMVSLVEQMLSLHKALAAAHSPAEKERLERQIKIVESSA